MPNSVFGIEASEVKHKIGNLIVALTEIEDTTGEFLQVLDDGRVIDTKGWNGWDWTHGVALFGLWKYHELTGDKKALDVIVAWFEDHFARGTPTKNINSAAPMLTLAHLYEAYGDRKYRAYLDRWGEYLMHDLPRTEEGGFQHIVFNGENRQQLWDDTLFMSVLPLTKIGLLLDRPKYVDEAKQQFLTHIKYLYDSRSGLWFHGWTFEGRHNFANALWARGNCWVTIAIPEFIEMLDLKEDDFLRRYLLDTLHAQVSAAARLQDESGLWHTLMTDESSYLEASATAGFAAGILKAVRKQYLPAAFEQTGVRALKGVLSNINARGELENTSFGTGMGSDLQFYRDIPLTPMPYGQSLSMLALTEFLQRTL
ncbi:glycoside hydrolase family 88 protein [Asticcacaulis sp. DXS10W]|uniref:Glycoside hydrolase family 88 protein n=1 Tax=Asticcacaulis currens TaxID=2984210 RepID=A0ABT5IC03_9CAUL|nr:glycoside hydrolase family 88 protein [Asticcacaulis currens]MDC7693706.1 glycoside hydrolase family 88 protein [Asticcacaulis currens]